MLMSFQLSMNFAIHQDIIKSDLSFDELDYYQLQVKSLEL